MDEQNVNQGAEADSVAESPESFETTLPVEDALPAVPEGLREVDQDKLKQVREKIKQFMEKRGTTLSGSEDPDSQARGTEVAGGADGDAPTGPINDGSKVDWSEYDLEYSVRHLYPRAVYRDTPQGPKWVTMLEEFYSIERAGNRHGKEVNVPNGKEGEKEPHNLGEYMTQMVNGPEGWAIAAILPGSMGNALIVMRKQSAYVLPDPTPLKKMEEVEAPSDPELAGIEEAALAFAADEGLTPPAQEPTQSEVELANRFIRDPNVEMEPGTSAIVARESNLVREALERNQPATVAAPVPAGIQPDAFEPEKGANGEKFDGAAGIENIRSGLRNLLEKDGQ